MPKTGPIVIVENDLEDQDVITHVLHMLQVKNELRFFENGKPALDFLLATTQQPFLILCDINMPLMNGFQLRQEICKSEYLRRKATPFIFLSTSDDAQAIKKAYELAVQGYFKKQNTFGAFKKDMQAILDYWTRNSHPSFA